LIRILLFTLIRILLVILILLVTLVGIACHLDSGPACHFDADPGPDPDPSLQINAENLEKVLKYAHLHFGLSSANWCGSGSSLSR
jgi:hypothetical protein